LKRPAWAWRGGMGEVVTSRAFFPEDVFWRQLDSYAVIFLKRVIFPRFYPQKPEFWEHE